MFQSPSAFQLTRLYPVLITGASKDSLGAEAAISLAAAGPKQFIFVGRSKERHDPVINAIKSIDSSIKITFIFGDMCDNTSLRKAASEINALPGVTIDSVIFSAGVMAVREFLPTKDGIETQLAANVIGHFLLFNLIIGKLANESTFVAVSSQGYELCGVEYEDYNFSVNKHSYFKHIECALTGILFYSKGRLITRGLPMVELPQPKSYSHSPSARNRALHLSPSTQVVRLPTNPHPLRRLN